MRVPRLAADVLAVMSVAEHEAFKAKARAAVREQQAQIAALLGQAAVMEEQLAGKAVPPCPACGGELACPQCSRGEDY